MVCYLLLIGYWIVFSHNKTLEVEGKD